MKEAAFAFGQMGTISFATLVRDINVDAIVMIYTDVRVECSSYSKRAVRQVAEIYSGKVYSSEEGLAITLPRK